MKRIKSKINRVYGWKRNLPNFKALRYGDVLPGEVIPLEQLPDSVDLRPQDSPIEDQTTIGSCTANAICGNIQFIQPGFTGSRLFVYYNERAIEGSTDTDSGAQISDGIESVTTSGICSESEWPYDVNQFTVKPPINCYTDAKKDVLSQYLMINGVQEMKSCLAQGFPYVFGFSVYESFESDSTAATGIMTTPGQNEECLGGHAVMAVGYIVINGIKYFIVRNSWGTGWGDKGYFYMPEEVMTNVNMASDWSTIRK
jgi:C1A family cysteine protease